MALTFTMIREELLSGFDTSESNRHNFWRSIDYNNFHPDIHILPKMINRRIFPKGTTYRVDQKNFPIKVKKKYIILKLTKYLHNLLVFNFYCKQIFISNSFDNAENAYRNFFWSTLSLKIAWYKKIVNCRRDCVKFVEWQLGVAMTVRRSIRLSFCLSRVIFK